MLYAPYGLGHMAWSPRSNWAMIAVKKPRFFLTTLNTQRSAKCNYWQYNITISLFRNGIHSNDDIHSICGLGSDLSVKDTGKPSKKCQTWDIVMCDGGGGSTLDTNFLVNVTKNYFTRLPYDWFSWDNENRWHSLENGSAGTHACLISLDPSKPPVGIVLRSRHGPSFAVDSM